MSALYRVPLLVSECASCCFTRGQVLPSENCPQPGVWVETLLFLLRLKNASAQIVVSKAPEYGLWAHDFKDSVLWQVGHGTADISLPHMVMTAARNGIKNIGTFLPYESNFLYKDLERRRSLNPFELGVRPIGLWVGIALCAFFQSFLVEALSRQQTLVRFELHLSLGQKLRTNFDFWRGIFLSSLASYVILIFVRPTLLKPISDFNSLRALIFDGKYKPIFVSTLNKQLMYDQNRPSHQSLLGSQFSNPPRVFESAIDAGAVIAQDSLRHYPRHVYMGNAFVRQRILSSYCDIDMIDSPTMSGYMTSYMSENLSLAFSQGEKKLGREHYHRLMQKYFPRRFCQGGNSNTGGTNGFVLTMEKFGGTFVCLGGLLTVGTAVLCTEIVTRLVFGYLRN